MDKKHPSYQRTPVDDVKTFYINFNTMFPAHVHHQLVLIKVEALEEWRPGVDQQDPESLSTQDKDDEPCTSLEDQLNMKEGTAVPLKSEDGEEKPLSSEIHLHQIEDRNLPADQMEAAAVGVNCGGAETPRNPDLKTHKDNLGSSETEVCKEDDEENLSDSRLKTEDINKDWMESRAPESVFPAHVQQLVLVKEAAPAECRSGVDQQHPESLTTKEEEDKPRTSLEDVQLIHQSLSCSELSEHSFNQFPQSDVTCQVEIYSTSGLDEKKNMGRHRKVQTKQKTFCCEDCGKRFMSKASLNKHRRVHTEDKSFTCDVCGQRFGRSHTLTAHMRVHSEQKPFPCNVCGQRFSQKAHLNTHTRIHTGEKPFPCDVCGKRFSHQTTLDAHGRIHTGDKPFPCDVCGQTFRHKTNLNAHLRIHTGDKPFSCDVCKQKFSQKAHLNSHVKIHTGDKPFSCDVCGQKFRQKAYLNSHGRIHTGDKPFPCEVCGQKFSQKSNLNKHLRIHKQ